MSQYPDGLKANAVSSAMHSCEQIAEQLLETCLSSRVWDGALSTSLSTSLSTGLLECNGGDELFKLVAEPLSDRFDPELCDVYAGLFSELISLALPDLDARELFQRYRRARKPRVFAGEAAGVIVLSRVTLGAEVAVTSVVLDAMKRRFPQAEILLAGSHKCWELFAGDKRITHLDVSYPREGSVVGKLNCVQALKQATSEPGYITIDPDSRLTQLGLLPVCPERAYFFFESRAYGGDSEEPLTGLVRRWLGETFQIEEANPYIALAFSHRVDRRPAVAISLGTGKNEAKRISGPFEAELLRSLIARGAYIYIDKGAGGEESERVERAIESFGPQARRIKVFEGAFAEFAATIAASDLYIGYDSAGQHVAAACGVPLISVFAGFASPRTFARWRPTGTGLIRIVRVENDPPSIVLEKTLHAIDELEILSRAGL